MSDTREQIAARVITEVSWTMDPHGFRVAAVHAAAGVSAGAKAVTNRVRELHHPVEIEPSDTICADCSWQLPNGRFFGKVIEWPCPDVALLDQIDAEMGTR